MHIPRMGPEPNTVHEALVPTLALERGTPVNDAEGPPLPLQGLGPKPSPVDEARGEPVEFGRRVSVVEVGVRCSFDPAQSWRV